MKTLQIWLASLALMGFAVNSPAQIKIENVTAKASFKDPNKP